jgi:DNA modification methylase
MAIKEDRKAIGFDIEKKYVEMGNKRTKLIEKYKEQELFKFEELNK